MDFDKIPVELVDPNLITYSNTRLNLDERFQDAYRQLENQMIRLQNIKIETQYLTKRVSTESGLLVELFLDESQAYSITADLQDDSDWNNNWKQLSDGGFEFQNGYLRQKSIPYMLEITDEYSLNNIGQQYKCGLSKYDSINECYWMMSNAGANAYGEITKIDKNMKDGMATVIGRWYLGAMGSSTYWSGIGVNGAGNKLAITNAASAANNLYSIQINSDGTLGSSHAESERTILSIDATFDYYSNTTVTCDSTIRYKVGQYIKSAQTAGAWIQITVIVNSTTMTIASAASGTASNVSTTVADTNISGADTTASSWATDITEYSLTEWAYILCNAATAVSLKFVKQTDLTTGTTTTITGFEQFAGDIDNLGRAIVYDSVGGILWMKVHNITTNAWKRTYKFILSTDIVSNIVIKHSGRFDFPMPSGFTREAAANEGISLTASYDVLESISTASNGRYIIKRAAGSGTKWAENQISGEFKPNAATPPHTNPKACCVEDNRYYWTADEGVTANQVDIYRFDTQTGTSIWGRLTNQAWTMVADLTIKASADRLYLLGSDGTNYEIFYGDLSDFVALMGPTGSGVPSITLGIAWGTLWAAGASNGNLLYGICYNADDDILYILNISDSRIDTLSSDGLTWTQGVYYLPAATNYWYGIAYKNGNIYVGDVAGSTTLPNRIYTLPVSRQKSSAWYRSHINLDPSQLWAANGRVAFDFHGNDIVAWCIGDFKFITMKILEDPNVIQLHTFLDANNELLSNNVYCATPIVQRYFEPEDFNDVRNIPDKSYMAVGYGNEGFSLLHLDDFLAEASSAGMPRRSPSKVKIQHYKKSSTNTIGSMNIVNTDAGAGHGTISLHIEKDMIFQDCVNASIMTPIVCIDLKNGKATAVGHSGYLISGFTYLGTLTERNDAKGWGGVIDTELLPSDYFAYKWHARTFFRGDSSAYDGANPCTIVAMATGGSTTGGVDLLRIDWDSDGNRTLVKVWNDIKNFATATTYGVWIAESGYIFILKYSGGNLYKSTKPVWQFNEEGSISAAFFTEIGSGIIGNYGREIAPSSRCWKLSDGTWRHQLLVGQERTGGTGTWRTAIVDVEMASIETLMSTIGVNAFSTNADMYEDMIYIANSQIANVLYPMILKKRRFFRNIDSNYPSNWMWYNNLNFSPYVLCRPQFLGYPDVAGTSLVCRYSPEHKALVIGSSVAGLQFFYFPVADEGQHKSIEIDAENPLEYCYKGLKV